MTHPSFYSFIFHHCVVGKDQAASEIVSGLIANVEPDMVAVLQLMVGRQLKVLVSDKIIHKILVYNYHWYITAVFAGD